MSYSTECFRTASVSTSSSIFNEIMNIHQDHAIFDSERQPRTDVNRCARLSQVSDSVKNLALLDFDDVVGLRQLKTAAVRTVTANLMCLIEAGYS